MDASNLLFGIGGCKKEFPGPKAPEREFPGGTRR